jgi:hypothetical protein
MQPRSFLGFFNDCGRGLQHASPALAPEIPSPPLVLTIYMKMIHYTLAAIWLATTLAAIRESYHASLGCLTT